MTRYTRFEIIGSLTAACLAAYSVYWWMTNLYSQRELVSVVAAARDLEAPRALSFSDLKTISLPRDALLKNGVTNAGSLVGKVLMRSVSANQIITARDAIADRDQDSAALLVPAGKVGATLSASWLTAAFPKIKPNDLIDVYAAFPASQRSPGSAGAVLKNILVLGVTSERDGTPSSVFLALDPSEATKLIQLHASQYPLMAVVESVPGVTEASSTAH